MKHILFMRFLQAVANVDLHRFLKGTLRPYVQLAGTAKAQPKPYLEGHGGLSK